MVKLKIFENLSVEGKRMYKTTVIVVHVLIFLFATAIGYFGVHNPSSPDPSRDYSVWYTAIVIFDLVVVISLFAHLKRKRYWLFLITVVALLILFYLLPHIVLFIEGI